MTEKNKKFTLSHRLIGIVVPLEDESEFLQKNIKHQKNKTINGVRYLIGTICNINIIFVLSGFGKINSAIITSCLLRDFRPDLVILVGSAGSINPTIKQGEVVIGKRVFDADLGILTPNGIQFKYQDYLYHPQTNKKMLLEFHINSELITFINDHVSNKILGTIATSDALPNPESQIKLLQDCKVDIIDMESVAIMQTCALFNTTSLIIRGVSNNAHTSISKQEIKLAAQHAATVLIDLFS